MPGRSRIRPLRSVAAAAGALVLLLPATARAGSLTPASPASPGAEDTRIAYVVMAIGATLLALAMIVAVLAAVRRGRAIEVPERRTRGGAGVQGRVGLALGVLAAAVFVFGVIVTESTRDADAASAAAEEQEPLRIQATGQQWLWRYGYPNGTFAYHELVVPADRTVILEVGAVDVLHRWWVPALAPMVDASPGDSSEVSFRAEETGSYEGASTRFSGPAFPTMRTRVRVISEDEFDGWLERQAAAIRAAQTAVREEVDEQVPSAEDPVEGNAAGRAPDAGSPPAGAEGE